MKRILFVDDEPRVLEGLENLLFPYMDEWDAEFVTSGAEALKRLDKAPFDVLVTDMRMPQMDGATLLQKTKQHHPEVVRVVLSGHAEVEAAVRALPIAHQFLSKPCSAEKLIDVINRACGLRSLVDDEQVRSLVGKIAELPARPKIYSELTALLANEDSSLDDVATIIEKDIGISTKVLQVVNTAFFSRGAAITTVRQAVPRLGAEFVKNLVLAVDVFRGAPTAVVGGFSIDELHEHSFLTAHIARRLLDDRKAADDAFLAGTLHDVGKLILATALPERFREVWARHGETNEPFFQVEYELNQVSHAEIGAYLLGLWGLPYTVMEAVANHHQPSRVESATFDAFGAVHVANHLANALMTGGDDSYLDTDYLARLGLLDRLDSWREMAAAIAEELR